MRILGSLAYTVAKAIIVAFLFSVVFTYLAATGRVEFGDTRTLMVWVFGILLIISAAATALLTAVRWT